MSLRALSMSTLLLFLLNPAMVPAQGRGAPPPQAAPQPARAAAPVDLTGYWVSIVSEDWPWRMITPRKGDYTNVPLNAEGRRVADTWDPAKDEAAGEQCKAYGAAVIMRRPVRIHITWENENTLRIDTDLGQQTRLLRFGAASVPAGPPAWQGYSAASWEFAGRRGGRGSAPAGGSLTVVTKGMRAGYHRTNGVPYSENTVLTEYFDRHSDAGAEWITLTQIIEDAKYLNEPWILTSHFKKESDGSKWNPTPCVAERYVQYH
jgi:hypothetical protein